jgi:general secretion pathway protein K
MPRKSQRLNRRDEAGFVLLLVVSAIGLLALVAAGFAQMARTHVRTAASASESAQAEALADAGVYMAVLDLLRAQSSPNFPRRFAITGLPTSCLLASSDVVEISVQDEGGKVDLNTAGQQLLRALAAGVGLADPEGFADAVLDYRDANDEKRPQGAERDEYRAAGRPQGPKNAQLAAVEELDQVLGVTASDTARLRPFVTLYSGQTAVDQNSAAPGLLEALVNGNTNVGFVQSGGAASTTRTAAGPLPSSFIFPSARRHFTIRVAARSTTGATFVREAVVELGGVRGVQSFSFRRWRRGALNADADLGQVDGLPHC